MNMLSAPVVGTIAVVLGLVGYAPYVIDIIRNKTKPHAFSWLIWFLLLVLGFFVQSDHNAGPSAWSLGFEGILCGIVFVFSLFRGERHIALIDWISLIGAFICMGIWFFAHEGLVALILVMIIDSLGFIPTTRKAFSKPYEETFSSYLVIAISFTISMFALTSYEISAWLYTVYLFVVNYAFAFYILIRRAQIKN